MRDWRCCTLGEAGSFVLRPSAKIRRLLNDYLKPIDCRVSSWRPCVSYDSLPFILSAILIVNIYVDKTSLAQVNVDSTWAI